VVNGGGEQLRCLPGLRRHILSAPSTEQGALLFARKGRGITTRVIGTEERVLLVLRAIQPVLRSWKTLQVKQLMPAAYIVWPSSGCGPRRVASLHGLRDWGDVVSWQDGHSDISLSKRREARMYQVNKKTWPCTKQSTPGLPPIKTKQARHQRSNWNRHLGVTDHSPPFLRADHTNSVSSLATEPPRLCPWKPNV